MTSTQRKTVKVALWEYTTPAGGRRRAFFGDQVELTEAEVKRGEAAGVFDQPPAGPVDTPFLSKAAVHQEFAKALAGIEPRTPEPTGDDGLAKLHHDLQPVEVETVEPVTAPSETPEPTPSSGSDEDDQLRADGKPLKVAKKDVLVDWLAPRTKKFTRDELDQLDKDELWELINQTPVNVKA